MTLRTTRTIRIFFSAIALGASLSCTSTPRELWPPQPDSEGNYAEGELDAWTARRARPKAYVGLNGENAVAVVDVTAKQVIARIPVPAGPHGVALARDGRRVFV